MQKIKVLVTGGRGYVAGRLCEELVRHANIDVICASRSTLDVSFPRLQQRLIDWASDQMLLDLCRNVDAVIHLAAMNAQACAADPVAALEFNGGATVRLLNAAHSAKVKRFIYLSTAHVYGRPLMGRIDETTLPRPVHPYATSHRAAEDAVLAADASGWLTGVVLRMSNAFGRPVLAEADCWSLLFNDLCRQAAQGPMLVLKSSGMQRRNFIAMTDVCAAMHHVLTTPAERLGARMFNLGSDWSPTIYECAQMVADMARTITGSRPEIRCTAATGELSPALDYVIDALRASGFKPKQNHEKELSELMHYCLQNFRK